MHGNHRDRDLLGLAYRLQCTLLIGGACVGGWCVLDGPQLLRYRPGLLWHNG